MKFRLRADAIFEADDIDHALSLIVEHFQRMYNGQSSDLLRPSSYVAVTSVDERELELQLNDDHRMGDSLQ